MRRAIAVVTLLAASFLAATAATVGEEESLRLGFALAAARTADVDGDGAEDLVAIGHDGEVRVYGRTPEGLVARGEGPIRLADPSRTLLALGDLLGEGTPQLVTLSPRGVGVHRAAKDGGFEAEGRRIVRSARFPFRVGEPRFVELLTDVNRDGRLDLVVPRIGTWELWLSEGKSSEDDPAPKLRRVATVKTTVNRNRKTEPRRLTDPLESGFSIPSLRLRDVNGDGRLDLVVVDRHTREFHLQRDDGSIPTDADVRLDLEKFRDTTARAGVRPGKTVAGGDDAKLQIDDLDLDGIPDYLIFHRRKLWVFHGGKEGPQFARPTAILKTADDITALLVLHLDGDGRPDLLLVRVQVPTVGAILNGLYSQLDVDITASGYAGQDGRTFGRTPRWRGSIVLRLPEIMGVLRNPEALMRKFENTASKFRASATGDLDGDGRDDLAMVSEDGTTVDVWRGLDKTGRARDTTGLKALFFEEENRVYDIDRVLDWLSDAAERRSRSLTRGRDPDVRFELRDPARYERTDLRTADTDGDGKREVLVVYRDREEGKEGVVDVRRLR